MKQAVDGSKSVPVATKVMTLAGLLFVAYACGRTSAPSSSVAQSRSDYDSSRIQTVSAQDPALQRFIVPPELALMTLSLVATEESFPESTQLLQDSAAAVVEAVDGNGCSARMLEYTQPALSWGQSGLYDGRYSSQIDVEVEVSFAGLNEVGDRITRLDECVQLIPEFTTDNGKRDARLAIATSSVMPTLQDANRYRDELLQQRFTALQEVAAAANPPGQFEASKTVCTSDGTVKIVNRNISGIELDVDFYCEQGEFHGGNSEENGNT